MRVYYTCFQNTVFSGILLLIWNLVLPKDDVMKELAQEFPDQHAYIKTNLLYYVISVSCWGGSLLVACCLWQVAGCLALGIIIWYLYVLIWNLTQSSVVNDKVWAAAAAKIAQYNGIHSTIKWMYWIRIVPFMLCGLSCVCGCCILLMTLAKGREGFS